MSFPIKLVIYQKVGFLAVIDSTQVSQTAIDSTQVSQTASINQFFNELKACLKRISQAVKQRFALHNSSSAFAAYLENSQIENPSPIITQWEWQTFNIQTGSFELRSLPIMMKLVKYLEEEGAKKHPQLFMNPQAIGSIEIKSCLENLIEESSTGTLSLSSDLKELSSLPITSDVGARKRAASPVDEEAIKKKVPRESSPLPLTLSASPIQLFDPKGYQGSDSEEENEDELRSMTPSSTKEEMTREEAASVLLSLNEPVLPSTSSSTVTLSLSPDVKDLSPLPITSDVGARKRAASPVDEEVIKKKVPRESSPLPLPLSASPIQLFDPEGYQGSDSEEENEDELRSMTLSSTKEEMTKKETASVVLSLNELVLPSTSSSEVIPLAKEMNLIILPLFSIYKNPRAKITTYHLEYITRTSKLSFAEVRGYVRLMLARNEKYISDIIKPDSTAVIKFKEPLVKEKHFILNKEEALLVILQGTQATLHYVQENYPYLIPKKSHTYDAELSLKKVISLLENTLQQFPHLSFSNLLEKAVSAKTLLTPIALLKQLVQNRKDEITKAEIMKESGRSPDAPYFTYIFAIQRLSKVHVMNFNVLYIKLEVGKKWRRLIDKCRRSLKTSLILVNRLLASTGTVNQIIFVHPDTQEKEIISDPKKILQILLEGLSENYLYMSKYTPTALQEHGQPVLERQLYGQIQDLRQRSALSADLDLSTKSKIISQLIEKSETKKSLSLRTIILSSEKSKMLPHKNYYYTFLINRIGGHQQGHYHMFYKKREGINSNAFYRKARESIYKTLDEVMVLLQNPQIPQSILFSDPLALPESPRLDVTSPHLFWPIILRGLTEMKILYAAFDPNFLRNRPLNNFKDKIEATIQAILTQKAIFCPHPITEVSLLSKLMKEQAKEKDSE